MKELTPVELHKAAFEYADLCPSCDPEFIQCSECHRLGKYFGYKEGYRKAFQKNDKGRI